LATLATNSEKQPVLVNGRILKSMNQFYNKEKARLQSYIGDKGTSKRIDHLTLRRNNKIHDYMHKSSRFIIDYCLKNQIGNIVIGYNSQWKDEVNLGKRTNQKFVSIPYLKLVKQIQYKAEEVGISVFLNEESYTSKCDALALEEIKKHDVYLGKRVKRGLFKSSTKKLLNADVNGSLNILRKVIGDGFINLLNIGLADNPVRINPYQYAL
jgi:putative transposase